MYKKFQNEKKKKKKNEKKKKREGTASKKKNWILFFEDFVFKQVCKIQYNIYKQNIIGFHDKFNFMDFNNLKPHIPCFSIVSFTFRSPIVEFCRRLDSLRNQIKFEHTNE